VCRLQCSSESETFQVEDVHAPIDRETSERRPFVFVTFESSSAAEEACDERNHTLGGKDVSTSVNTVLFVSFLDIMFVMCDSRMCT